MELKTKVLVVLLLSIFSLSMLTTVPVAAFAADSYAQKAGDAPTWEVKVFEMSASGPMTTVGDRQRVTVKVANQTELFEPTIPADMWFDTLYVDLEMNSEENRTWELIQEDVLIGGYNNSIGLYIGVMFFIGLIAPRNQTTINTTLYKIYSAQMYMGICFTHFLFTPGPNGYDGSFEMWNGSASGDLGEPKAVVKYNKAGLAEYNKQYNGTGSGWNLTMHMELLAEGGIPGFQIAPIVLMISVFGTIALLRPKKLDLPK